jgi:Glycosyl hydrolase family 3 C-terminal domain
MPFSKPGIPGEEGGTAIAETLAGDNNPAGRLPLTFYSSLDQVPSFKDYSMKSRTYRYFSDKPLYSFGFGLSYANFTYGSIKLPSSTIKAGDPITVEGDVKNTGPTTGDEVVELYLTAKIFGYAQPSTGRFHACSPWPRPVYPCRIQNRFTLDLSGRLLRKPRDPAKRLYSLTRRRTAGRDYIGSNRKVHHHG